MQDFYLFIYRVKLQFTAVLFSFLWSPKYFHSGIGDCRKLFLNFMSHEWTLWHTEYKVGSSNPPTQLPTYQQHTCGSPFKEEPLWEPEIHFEVICLLYRHKHARGKILKSKNERLETCHIFFSNVVFSVRKLTDFIPFPQKFYFELQIDFSELQRLGTTTCMCQGVIVSIQVQTVLQRNTTSSLLQEY